MQKIVILLNTQNLLFTKLLLQLQYAEFALNFRVIWCSPLCFSQKLYKNLLGMDAVRMVKPHNLKKELCINALTCLMFLKHKRTRKIKARGCADRQPQQDFIGKEETSSPTGSVYILMVCCAISSVEKRHVVACDISEAFLQLD